MEHSAEEEYIQKQYSKIILAVEVNVSKVRTFWLELMRDEKRGMGSGKDDKGVYGWRR